MGRGMDIEVFPWSFGQNLHDLIRLGGGDAESWADRLALEVTNSNSVSGSRWSCVRAVN